MKTYTVIKNKRLLKSIEKLGFIKEAQHEVYPHCACGVNYQYLFEYKNNYYYLKYLNGDFSPYLVKSNELKEGKS